ncbi:MAG TPA: glutamate-5-semialdehyde dehydrogenase [Candidatus Methanoperedens sp.]|nr:glutamate-5-semialdehyde dehydrogenase [Candidatus Methanoperedens sp.]
MAKQKSPVLELALAAKQAARRIAGASTGAKNTALLAYARRLETEGRGVLEANARDLEAARRRGLSAAMQDRLQLDPQRLAAIAQGLREIAALPDPVGEITRMTVRPNGLRVGRMRVPLGVIAIVYEARPNVTCDAAGLCIKSGNAVILRGGSEAFHSSTALARLAALSLAEAGLPAEAVTMLPTTDRAAVVELLKLDGVIDLVIPRGGKELIRAVVEGSTIPVIFHYEGVCHTYVDEGADVPMAVKVCFNAKVQRPGVCNAMETLLVHEGVAPAFFRKMLPAYRKAGVEIRGCARTKKLAPWVKAAKPSDYGKEFLELILAVKVVDSLEEAMAHIARYGSMHTDAIITRDHGRAMRFVAEVDSSSVIVNASTRFSDGFQYGLGAEMGISTQKLHARGPMGLEELTCQKFVVLGDGQIRE